jgi:hypothetical protein
MTIRTRIRDFGEWLNAFWWRLWTGHDNLRAARRAIECDAHRFGGRVHWYRKPFERK